MKTVVIGSEKLTIEQVVSIAKRQVNVELDSSAEFQKKIDTGAEFLDEALAKHGGIYGVTTGYGDSCTQVTMSCLSTYPVSTVAAWATILTKKRPVLS